MGVSMSVDVAESLKTQDALTCSNLFYSVYPFFILVSTHRDTMSAATPTPLPPIEVVSATNHGAWVIITAAIGLTIGLVCLMIRFYVRLAISPPFSRDDHVHTAATVRLASPSSKDLWQLTPNRFSLSPNPASFLPQFRKVSANQLN